MLTNQYRFRGNVAIKNDRRIFSKWDLLCAVEEVARENYRLVCGNTMSFVCHYDHLTCAELVEALRELINRYNELTK